MAKGKWIQKATDKMQEKGTVGSLRRATGAKKGQPIPEAKLEAAKNSDNPAMRKKANFAINVRK